MDNVELKLALVQAASSAVAGIVSNLPDDLKADPELANPETSAETWMSYRLIHALTIGLANALDPDNPKHWEWPAGLEKLASAGGGQGALLTAIEKLLVKVGGGAPSGTPPVTEPLSTLGAAPK